MHDSILHEINDEIYCEKTSDSTPISLYLRRSNSQQQQAKFDYSESFFSRSKLVIMGGNFIAHMGSQNDSLHGWNMLAENISKDVFHDSTSRFTLPKNTDGQHADVGRYIISLIMEQTTSTRTIRIYVASGTSEIAQYIADCCSTSNIRPATFFFRGPEEEYFSSFIPTIAYQLCLIFPELRKLVSQVINNDPAILSRSPLAQLEALIILPFIDIRRSWPDGPNPKLVVIVDAIHKCSSAHQRILVQAISGMAERFAFPATFLIFNKPTKNTELTFQERANTQSITIKIRSRRLFKPLIRKFVLWFRTIFHFSARCHSV